MLHPKAQASALPSTTLPCPVRGHGKSFMEGMASELGGGGQGKRQRRDNREETGQRGPRRTGQNGGNGSKRARRARPGGCDSGKRPGLWSSPMPPEPGGEGTGEAQGWGPNVRPKTGSCHRRESGAEPGPGAVQRAYQESFKET